MYVLEMLVRGIRSLKDAFPEGLLAWLPERLQRGFKAQAQSVGTQGTQVGLGTCSRTQLACTLLLSPQMHRVFLLLPSWSFVRDAFSRLELRAYWAGGPIAAGCCSGPGKHSS